MDPSVVPHSHFHRHGEDAGYVAHEHEHDHEKVTARTWRHHERTQHGHGHVADDTSEAEVCDDCGMLGGAHDMSVEH